ncbi:hypothetical protein RYX36_013399 [Vicia faba]
MNLCLRLTGPNAVEFIINHAEVSIAFVQENKIASILSCLGLCSSNLKTIVSFGNVSAAQKKEAEEFGASCFSWEEFLQLDTVTPVNLIGYGLAFLGVAYYNHSKLQALKASETQKKALQNDEEAGRSEIGVCVLYMLIQCFVLMISKDLKDSRVLTDVGDVPIQEIRDCGVDDKRLMSVIGESVKLVMEEAPLRPLVLGGDHSISFPVIRAVSEKLGGPVDVLHIDAHPDNYDAFEGNIYSHASSFARVMEGDYVRRLLQVGIRSITAEGRAQAKKFGVEQYEMRTFSRDRPFLENLKLGEGVKGVYISIDVDCLDPAFAPGVSHIEPGGLSFRDVLNILHNLQGDVVAGDVVELNPQCDTVDGMTAMVAAKLVREMAAKIAK